MLLLQESKVNLGSGDVIRERKETNPWIIPTHALSDLDEFLRHLRRYGHEARNAMDSIPWGVVPSLMDMIQVHLDSTGSQEDPTLRKTCINCLLRLNKCHFSLPPSLHLANVVKDGSHPVAGGGFADIWKGRLRDERPVCLKVLRVYTGNFDKNKLMKQLGNEVLIWRQLRHPNVHKFLGITDELFEPSYCIVSPWMANGDVMSYCRERGSSLDVKVAMMQGFCEGLRYLHEHNPPIVHSDIKGVNILVSDDGHCRISDFGLSTIENDSSEGRVSDSTSQAAMRGSLPWLAPELMNPSGVESPNRTTRDIYALGCTMYEILAGSPPFSDRKMDPQIIFAVLGGVRPTRPAGCPDHLWMIIEKCWTEDSEARLVASQVVALLDQSMPQSSLSSSSITSVITAEADEFAGRLPKGIQLGHVDQKLHPHPPDMLFQAKNRLLLSSISRSRGEGIPRVHSSRKRGIDKVDSPTESETPANRRRLPPSPPPASFSGFPTEGLALATQLSSLPKNLLCEDESTSEADLPGKDLPPILPPPPGAIRPGRDRDLERSLAALFADSGQHNTGDIPFPDRRYEGGDESDGVVDHRYTDSAKVPRESDDCVNPAELERPSEWRELSPCLEATEPMPVIRCAARLAWPRTTSRESNSNLGHEQSTNAQSTNSPGWSRRASTESEVMDHRYIGSAKVARESDDGIDHLAPLRDSNLRRRSSTTARSTNNPSSSGYAGFPPLDSSLANKPRKSSGQIRSTFWRRSESRPVPPRTTSRDSSNFNLGHEQSTTSQSTNSAEMMPTSRGSSRPPPRPYFTRASDDRINHLAEIKPPYLGHRRAATLSFRSDPPPDPIWDYISVRDAWKGFRLRVGTSELAGVLPSSYRV